jgi:hypothetical protein
MPLLPIRRNRGADSPQFDELLGTGAAPMGDAGWQRVSEVFGSAAADPTASELTVDPAARAAFRHAHLGVPARRHLVRSNMINTLLSSKIAGAIACAAIGVTGAAGAAYANVLPRPIQDIAHNTIGAPPTHGDPGRHGVAHNDDALVVASPSVSATASPSASASAVAARLCGEWSDAAEGKIDDDAANVHAQLAVLAGGDANIAAFCATAGDRDNDEHHGATPSPTASPSATTSAGDDQRHDQGDDHGRDGASASPTQGSNRGPNPSPTATRTDNSGPGNNNGSDDNSGPGNNSQQNNTDGPDNSGPGNNNATTNTAATNNGENDNNVPGDNDGPGDNDAAGDNNGDNGGHGDNGSNDNDG